MALQDMAQVSAAQSIAMLGNADVTWGEHECRAIFDQPGDIVLDGQLVTTDYQVTYLTSALPGIEQGAEITVTPDATGEPLAFTTRSRDAGSDGCLSTIGLQE
jgi:hypothetical protein